MTNKFKPVPTSENDTSLHGASVRLEGLGKRYGSSTKPAVQHVNLNIKPGEFVTLLGPSGSGKTTTLMMIAGFESVTTGDIVIDGQSIVNLAPHQRDIGVLFQSYALFPHMTVRENIAFPLKMRRWKRPDIDRAVIESLALVRLEEFSDRLPSQLSGGQQQRVALARATVFTPKLLLLDEPLSALDRQLRQTMQFEIKRIQRSLGLTVISVTHDQEEALTMSDLVVVMNNGTIIQSGTSVEVYEQPQTEFIADFIGETNIIRGRVVSNAQDGSLVKVEGGFDLQTSARLLVGDAVTISIRPEHIVVTHNLPASIKSNVLHAKVLDWVYSGPTTRGTICIGNSTLVVRVDRAGVLSARDVMVEIDPNHAVVVNL